MKTTDRKAYAKPEMKSLGSLATATQSGNVTPSDDGSTPDSAQPIPGGS